MAYVKEIFRSIDKEIMIVKKHHSLFAMPTKAKIKQKRMPKMNETDLTQEKINERIRREKNMRLLADNFRAGDFYVTLTTREKMNAEEFKMEMKNFMKRLRRDYEKRTGEKVKYFRVLENLLGKGRPHAHMLLPKFCDAAEIRDLLMKMWPAGNIKVELYGGTAQDAYNVSSYFTKQTKKDQGAKIDTSRGNLIRREPKKQIVHAETFRDEIVAPAGYRVVKPLSYNTFTSTGHHYQIAVFEKIDGSVESEFRRRDRERKEKICGGGKQKPRVAARKND